jgi:hypothetical protein
MPEIPVTAAPTPQTPTIGQAVTNTITGFGNSIGSSLTTAGTNLKDSVSFDRNQQGNIPLGNLLPNISVTNANATWPNASIPPMNISSILCAGNGPPSLAGIASKLGVPTSLPGLAVSVGNQLGFNANMSIPQALSTLGLPSNLKDLSSSIAKALGTNLPKIPQFPGLDMVGIALGAGPKFIADTIMKYKLIVPPYIPGVKINFAMVAAALTIIKTLANTNPSELLKAILGNIKDDLTCDLLEQLTDPETSEKIQIDLNKEFDGLTKAFGEKSLSEAASNQQNIASVLKQDEPNISPGFDFDSKGGTNALSGIIANAESDYQSAQPPPPPPPPEEQEDEENARRNPGGP